MHYIVEGGKKIEGEVDVSGSKNASLPILAASILGEKSTLYNVPNIEDTKTTQKILAYLGCKVVKKNDKICIDSSSVNKFEIPGDLMHKMRSSVVIAGAILGRFKKVNFSYPGGCEIGARPIDLHLKVFERLNVNIQEESGKIYCYSDELIGNNIHLDFPSVGATESAMMAACMAKGETIITNAAMEPEIVDLQNFLNRMGAKVQGAGTNSIRIIGVKRLRDVSYNIMPDRIEAGTLLCMAMVTRGNIRINKVVPEHIRLILYKLEECGAKIYEDGLSIILEAPKRIKSIEIKTMPYPGFPTDMQSVFGAMLTTSKGTSIIIENIFENRFKYINELKKMNAKIEVEGKMAVIKGIKKLSSAEVEATDLRGGAALCTAALSANGMTKINNIEHILRGYEDLDKKLNTLGAKIERCK